MGTSTKSVSHPIAVLKLPEYEAPRFIIHARALVRAMAGNSWFPAPDPPLATVSAAIEALDAAQTATLTRAAGTIATRDEKRLAALALLQQLCTYVQAVAYANPENAAAIIESAGMNVKKKRVLRARVFAAEPGDVSGSVNLFAPRAGARAAYEWSYSTDGGTTWESLPNTVKASTTVVGLRPGSRVGFRYRVTTKDGVGDWSEPVWIIVL
jgi:hypothetical protein